MDMNFAQMIGKASNGTGKPLVRIATVKAVDSRGIQLQFADDSKPSSRRYKHIKPASVAIGDRVACLRIEGTRTGSGEVGGTYLVLGTIVT